jgi:hypothetical protein
MIKIVWDFNKIKRNSAAVKKQAEKKKQIK